MRMGLFVRIARDGDAAESVFIRSRKRSRGFRMDTRLFRSFGGSREVRSLQNMQVAKTKLCVNFALFLFITCQSYTNVQQSRPRRSHTPRAL